MTVCGQAIGTNSDEPMGKKKYSDHRLCDVKCKQSWSKLWSGRRRERWPGGDGPDINVHQTNYGLVSWSPAAVTSDRRAVRGF